MMNKTEFRKQYRVARLLRWLADGHQENDRFDEYRATLDAAPNEAWMAVWGAMKPRDALAVPFAGRWFDPYEGTTVYGPVGVLPA